MVVLTIVLMLTVTGWFMLIPPPLIVQGQVEATEVKVASKIAGRIKQIHVKEGQPVRAGEILITLGSPEIKAKYRQARAAEQVARANQKKAYRGTRREQIQSAKNVWLKAKAASDLARKTYNRINSLYSEGVVPAQKRDEAEAKKQAAEMTERAAKATYSMALAGARTEDKAMATAMTAKAAGAVSEVQAYLDETSLTAPLNSEVSDITSQLGELVSPGYPVVKLVDLSDIWVTFNLREDLLADIRMGDVITAKFPALKDREIKLKVNYIAVEGDFATWRATQTSGDFDMKTFEVRAVPLKKVQGLRPGMSALVDWDDVPTERDDNNSSPKKTEENPEKKAVITEKKAKLSEKKEN